MAGACLFCNPCVRSWKQRPTPATINRGGSKLRSAGRPRFASLPRAQGRPVVRPLPVYLCVEVPCIARGMYLKGWPWPAVWPQPDKACVEVAGDGVERAIL